MSKDKHHSRWAGTCTPAAPASAPRVAIVDCDPQMRASLVQLLDSARVLPLAFSGSSEFLRATLDASSDRPDVDLLLCRLELEEDRGLELLQRLRNAQHEIPTVVYSTCGDVPTAVSCFHSGALDFIEYAKPDACFCQRILRHLPPPTAPIASPPAARPNL